jgi:hypothetical protein
MPFRSMAGPDVASGVKLCNSAWVWPSIDQMSMVDWFDGGQGGGVASKKSTAARDGGYKVSAPFLEHLPPPSVNLSLCVAHMLPCLTHCIRCYSMYALH